MVPIYIKLGTADEFHDERLNFHLVELSPKGILDYSNLNEHITLGLLSGEIVQISEAEYYALTPPPATPPITVIPTELINITEFIDPCPLDATLFFAHYAGKWYKVLWSTIKQCASTGSFTPLKFRVGDPANDLDVLPDVAEDRFTNPALAGKNAANLQVIINGIEIYHRSTYEPQADEAEHDWWVLHEDTNPGDTDGMLKRSVNFLEKDIVVIRGI